MSALPAEGTPPYDPHRIEPDEGPQTVQQLRAALAAVAPAQLVAFNEAMDEALDEALHTDGVSRLREIVTEYRHVWALNARPEVTAALHASLAGTAELRPVSELLDQDGEDRTA